MREEKKKPERNFNLVTICLIFVIFIVILTQPNSQKKGVKIIQEFF